MGAVRLYVAGILVLAVTALLFGVGTAATMYRHVNCTMVATGAASVGATPSPADIKAAGCR